MSLTLIDYLRCEAQIHRYSVKRKIFMPNNLQNSEKFYYGVQLLEIGFN